MPPTDDPLAALFAALPAQASNSVGGTARSVLVNRLKGVTPGSHTQAWPLKAQPTFRAIFFPSYAPVPLEGDVAAVTGLPDQWWSDLVVALLARAVYDVSAVERGHVDVGAVDAAVAAAGATLSPRLVDWYGHVLSVAFPPVASALAALPDRAAALDAYAGHLTSPDWVGMKRLQWLGGTWVGADWELFHHWVKLALLGASDDRVAGVITAAAGLGLPVPARVGAAAWRSYLAWMTPSSIGPADVEGDARPGLLGCAALSGCFAEENSVEFMARSQPGGRYWRS
ncbi:hypothetical protein [Polymorphospora sp. NPDC050346]|uniref:hypothetical protein n=1 Tax=Polymorphospora sp. NPDC050346 TaxID=3155780 RepID=UPI0033E0971A